MKILGLLLVVVGAALTWVVVEEIRIRRRKAALRHRCYEVTGYRGVW